MNASPMASRPQAYYELHFRSLHDKGRTFAFSCDARGHVDIDALGDRARNNYFYARTVVGREFSMPAVQVSAAHEPGRSD